MSASRLVNFRMMPYSRESLPGAGRMMWTPNCPGSANEHWTKSCSARSNSASHPGLAVRVMETVMVSGWFIVCGGELFG